MCAFLCEYLSHIRVCWCQTELVSSPLPTRHMPYVVQQIGSVELRVSRKCFRMKKTKKRWWNLAQEQMIGTDLNSFPLFMRLCVHVQSFQCHLLSLLYQFCHFFSQVTNSLISTYETTADITEADVNVTVMYMRFQNLSMFFFYPFLTFHLSFFIIHKHVIKCHLALICHRLQL